MGRKGITASAKHALVCKWRVTEGTTSQQQLCRDHGIQQVQLLCYIDSYNKMEKAKRSSWLLCTGRELMLVPYKIIDWIEMLCANSMYVCWSLVLLRCMRATCMLVSPSHFPTWADISHWCCDALGSISRETTVNAWHAKDFNWFLPGVDEAAAWEVALLALLALQKTMWGQRPTPRVMASCLRP